MVAHAAVALIALAGASGPTLSLRAARPGTPGFWGGEGQAGLHVDLVQPALPSVVGRTGEYVVVEVELELLGEPSRGAERYSVVLRSLGPTRGEVWWGDRPLPDAMLPVTPGGTVIATGVTAGTRVPHAVALRTDDARYRALTDYPLQYELVPDGRPVLPSVSTPRPGDLRWSSSR